MLRPGLIIQHAREEAVETGLIRSDHTGFIGIVPVSRWPRGGVPGDYFEMTVRSYGEFQGKPAHKLLDGATRDAVRAYYENGGEVCTVFGLCVESHEQLMENDPFSTLFHGLLDRLRGLEDLALLAMPVLAYLPIEYVSNNRATVRSQAVVELLFHHCREMNHRFLVLDTPRDLHGAALFRWVGELRTALEGSAAYGALYYPWLQDGDEVAPPSGAVTGLYGRLEREHNPLGVRWPPANDVLRGVTHTAMEVRWSETESYNEQGINAILSQPARGVVVWGARTLSKDPRWLHINSRRIVSFITEQLRRDAEWVVFENQRPELWQIITRMVTTRMDGYWNAGLLTGDQAGSEYMVQCDAETNPAEVRDAGQIHVKVVLRPISTAEYIVVDLRLGADGGL